LNYYWDHLAGPHIVVLSRKCIDISKQSAQFRNLGTVLHQLKNTLNNNRFYRFLKIDQSEKKVEKYCFLLVALSFARKFAKTEKTWNL
jgi:hypothetical protein